MGLHVLLGIVRRCICLFCGLVFTSQMALLIITNIQTEYLLSARPNWALQFLAGKENIIIFTQKSFYLQGILNGIDILIFLWKRDLFMLISNCPRMRTLHVPEFSNRTPIFE